MFTRVLIGGTLACCAALASAQVLVSENFDSYTTGSLLRDHAPWDSTGSSGFTISTEHSQSASKSAKIVGSSVTGSTDFAWVNLNGGNNFTFNPLGPNLSGAVSMWMNSGLQSTDWMGMVLFDQLVNRIGGIRYNGAGSIQFWNGGDWVATQVVAPMNSWVSLRVDAVYASASAGKIQYYVNDLRFDQFQVNYASGFAVSDFNLYQFGNATGYFDDYSVKAVPEPATLAALALGLIALRRRSKIS